MSGSPPQAPFPRWALAVDCTLSALSVVGGLAIIVGYICASQKQHLRLKLILGLGVTDFVQALTTLAGTALNLAGHPYVANSSSCLGSSFVYQACVICNACWTLAITIVTFASLLYPHSRTTIAFESAWAFPVIATICVAVSIAPSIAVTAVYPMQDAAGVCWLAPTTLASKLELFIPRAAVLAVVILLYLRMFIFFRQRDLHLLDTSSNSHAVESTQHKRFSLARLASRRSRVETHPLSQTSTNGFTAAAQPVRRLSAAPTIPPLDEELTPNEDGETAPEQVRKDSAATVSFSDHDTVPFGAAAQPVSLPRLPKADILPLAPADPPTAPRNVPLSPRQMNKRLSILMMAYPVAYSALVAVSVARLIQQFATGGRPNPGLLYSSRFLIFSQGLVDGILYLAIQTAFRYWTRRGRPART